MARKRHKKCRGRNQHHVYPESRFPERRNDPTNIVDVNVDAHNKYHWLFRNRTPEEILEYLVRYFWGGYIPTNLNTLQTKVA